MNFCFGCNELATHAVEFSSPQGHNHEKLFLCEEHFVEAREDQRRRPDCTVHEIRVIFRTQCRVCHTVHRHEVNEEKYIRWIKGTPIQEVWPEKNAYEGELMISGTCDNCFKGLFK